MILISLVVFLLKNEKYFFSYDGNRERLPKLSGQYFSNSIRLYTREILGKPLISGEKFFGAFEMELHLLHSSVDVCSHLHFGVKAIEAILLGNLRRTVKNLKEISGGKWFDIGRAVC